MTESLTASTLSGYLAIYFLPDLGFSAFFWLLDFVWVKPTLDARTVTTLSSNVAKTFGSNHMFCFLHILIVYIYICVRVCVRVCVRECGSVRQFQLLLTKSWKWRTTLHCEIPSSPDTLRELCVGSAFMVWVGAYESPILGLTNLSWYLSFPQPEWNITYLGSSVSTTGSDIDTWLTKARTAYDRLSVIWKSDLTDKMKRSFFQAAVMSILLYGCTTCTLTKRMEKKLDGNYTRMLRAILNRSWRQHRTKQQLYGHLPPITKTIQVRRTRHAGHCWRNRDELHKWCTPMDPITWPSKKKATSSNLHTAALWGYGI